MRIRAPLATYALFLISKIAPATARITAATATFMSGRIMTGVFETILSYLTRLADDEERGTIF